MSAVEERSYVEEARREHRAALEARGIPAFAYRFERSHTVAQARGLYREEMEDQGPVVAVAGR
ncbi:MAG: lysine--tRNA ligase, partial [Gemmatimonadales bacterium]